MNSNNSQNGNSQIHYRRQEKKSPYKNAVTAVLIGIIVLGIIVYIMSLAGVGLFREPDGRDEPKETEKKETGKSGETQGESTPGTVLSDGVTYRFVDKTMAEIYTGDLILIDKDHIYAAADPSLDELGPMKRRFSLVTYSQSLKPKAAEALVRMTDELYSVTGFGNVHVSDAYRSIDDQQKLYDSYPDGAAKPGCSDYHTGASLSLSGYGNGKSVPLWGTEAGNWLKENAHRFGFIFRYPSDKKNITGYSIDGQMRYVGAAHAAYMYENGLCLEEYLEILKEFTFSGKHLKVNADGNMYEIFYVEAVEGGTVKLPIADNRECTVSGDNKGGYIVTVLTGESKNAESSGQ